jgi:hypothetical protein
MDYFNTPNEFSDVKISFKNENGKNEKCGRGFGNKTNPHAHLSESQKKIKSSLL